MFKILLGTPDGNLHGTIGRALGTPYEVTQANTGEACQSLLLERRYDYLFLDASLLESAGSPPDGDGEDWTKPYRSAAAATPLIILADTSHIRQAVHLVKSGGDDYINLPFDATEAKHVMEQVLRQKKQRAELQYLRGEAWHSESFPGQTRSPLMKKVYQQIQSVATTKSTVLLLGETGTGKGVLSRLIHQSSHRRTGAYISIHCGAIPENLVESELFGHEKGAFTGAYRQQLGKFELANNGTLFLDEIGTISKSAQIKLLKVLQEKILQRVGGHTDITCNARIIAATNEDLKAMSEAGNFRQDLYYRLNVFPIEIPPLRDRLEDIPVFVDGFLRRLNEYEGKNIHTVDPQVLEAFKHYHWPGNIRELENLVERAYILESTDVLRPESFPRELMGWSESESPGVFVDTEQPLAEARRLALEDVERNYLKKVLEQSRGKIMEAAKTAGITTRGLHKLLSKYGIRKEEFKG